MAVGESIHWAVDGKRVPFEWSTATMSAAGGYERVTGARVPVRKMPTTAGQASRIKGHRSSSGEIIWEGEIAAPPKVVKSSDGGNFAEFECIGPVEQMRRQASRLPYQVRDATQWDDRSSLPYDTNNNKRIDLIRVGDAIGWALQKDQPITATHVAGYATFISDWKPQRIAFTIRKSEDDSAYSLQFLTANDLGSFNSVTTWSLGVVNPDGTAKDYTIAGADSRDTLSLCLLCDTDDTPTEKIRFWLTNLRVNYIADGDNYTTSDVMADLAERCGFSSESVTSSSLNAMPLDWSGPWDGLAELMASMDDWPWVVVHDKRGRKYGDLRYDDWGRDGDGEWSVKLGDGVEESLTYLPAYNRCTTFYERPAGVIQAKVNDFADFDLTDPLDDQGVTRDWPEPFSIEDPQPGPGLAEAVNERILRRVTKPRVAGTVKIHPRRAGAKKVEPFSVQAGDTLEIRGMEPSVGIQRIAGVTYSPDGAVECQIEREVVPEAIARRLMLNRRRRQRRRG